MNLCALSDHIILKILAFLDVRTVFVDCMLSCKNLSTLVFSNKNIVIQMIHHIIGEEISENTRSQLDYKALLDILKSLVIFERKDIDLPFYGYSANCGSDANDPRYLFHQIFRRKKNQAICTAEGKDYWIKGALAYDFFALQHAENPTEISLTDQEFSDMYKYLTSKREDIFAMLEESRRTKKDYNLEYRVFPRASIIKSFKISRSGDVSCPVKSMMLFSSMKEIVEDDPTVSLFRNVTTELRLRELYVSSQRDELPKIHFTNIPYLSNLSKYFDSKTKGVSFVLFSHKNHGKNVKPMLWLRFTELKRKELEVTMRNHNFFASRYCLVKLYDCDDRMIEFEDFSENTNIDVNYISLKGSLTSIL